MKSPQRLVSILLLGGLFLLVTGVALVGVPAARIGYTSENPDYVVMVLRERERMSYSEKDQYPHRASQLRIYQKNGDEWSASSPVYKVRSQSTSLFPPEDTDRNTVINHVKVFGEYYPYGYKSIPNGYYQLSWPEEVTDNEKTYHWLMISDWGQHNVIELDEAQEIRYCYVDGDLEDGNYVQAGRIDTSTFKNECYLHGTITRYWSHRDSQGCINLYHPDGPEESDYLMLVEDLKEAGAYSENAAGGLFLLSAAEIGYEDLPESIPSLEVEKLAKRHLRS